MVREGVPRLLPAAECERVLSTALDAAGAPTDAKVTLTLTDDAELATLNDQHMGKPDPTDVLSFPLLPPSVFPPHAGEAASIREVEAATFQLPPGEPVSLGDVVISVERAIAQAEAGAGGQTSDVHWSPRQELRLLLTHGALHLCGWDHADPVEEKAMRALESRLLGLEVPS